VEEAQLTTTKNHVMSNNSSKLSQLISVEVKALEDEAKNRRKQELRTTDVMLRKEVHEDYIYESKREDVQRFD
jgi:predicted transcriptional regulator